MYLQFMRLEKHSELMQLSWNFMNDSLRTDVFVRYQPETIACACIFLSARKLRIPLPKNPQWFLVFKVEEDEMNRVAYAILHLYSRPKVKNFRNKFSFLDLNPFTPKLHYITVFIDKYG